MEEEALPLADGNNTKFALSIYTDRLFIESFQSTEFSIYKEFSTLSPDDFIEIEDQIQSDFFHFTIQKIYDLRS